MQTLELCNSEVDETLVDLTCSAKQNVIFPKQVFSVSDSSRKVFCDIVFHAFI